MQVWDAPTVAVTGSTFVDSLAPVAALSLTNSPATVTSCDFNGTVGRALQTDTALTVTASRFADNNAQQPAVDGGGGGVRAVGTGAAIDMFASVFVNNTAWVGGAVEVTEVRCRASLQCGV